MLSPSHTPISDNIFSVDDHSSVATFSSQQSAVGAGCFPIFRLGSKNAASYSLKCSRTAGEAAANTEGYAPFSADVKVA